MSATFVGSGLSRNPPLRQGRRAFYDQISALHKSVRAARIRMPRCTGCAACSTAAPIPALHRRRVIRMAVEDIGRPPIRVSSRPSREMPATYERLVVLPGELAARQAIAHVHAAGQVQRAAYEACLNRALPMSLTTAARVPGAAARLHPRRPS